MRNREFAFEEMRKSSEEYLKGFESKIDEEEKNIDKIEDDILTKIENMIESKLKDINKVDEEIDNLDNIDESVCEEKTEKEGD